MDVVISMPYHVQLYVLYNFIFPTILIILMKPRINEYPGKRTAFGANNNTHMNTLRIYTLGTSEYIYCTSYINAK